MEEYFYYFGFIYLIHYSKSLYDVLTFEKFEEELKDILPDKMDMVDIMESRDKFREKFGKDSSKGILWFFRVVICWTWLITGLSVSSEPFIFLSLIILSVASYLTAIIYAISFMIKNHKEYIGTLMKNPKEGLQYLKERTPDTTIINVMDKGIRLGVVAFILYTHIIL